ncbi:CDP-glycerol glycerophosphotransferase family protein [Oceanobacillus kimchii]|uniref:CDP-glycerol glycerophosphotransferase family protein n=1 Tax=Oceanobacillus kimchii TaxID=746691 RepID=UPI0021A625BC|nr:CDP-glycerol glycerophosphotransferase family protein [Oceanobacillus kimchii]MCT1576577.1 CDP-glycerol glycerophosphotransferase family protein [Oceanobacillus kimchii]MCT2134647.1 CDP-glycerol glycerophosphotransferase family protein [Oceanobacillus kimchii]
MARELAISIYLFAFRVLFSIFKLYPQRKKTVAVSSFGDNIAFTVNYLQNLTDEEIVILQELNSKFKLDSNKHNIIPFDIKQHPIAYVKGIYHLATASTVLVDTYQGFLASTNFRPGTTCIQLWHAAGALKQFGLEDPSNQYRSKRALDRFKQVYSRFDYTVVGSEKMANTFKRSFGLTDNRILRTGIPRSDLLYDVTRRDEVCQSINKQFPEINGRRIILYTPTFRDEHLSNYQLELDIKQMYQSLSDEYVLFIKLHPAVSGFITNDLFEDFVFDLSDYKDTNELLLITDILISDYSSIPFEYAIMEKPMIFFAYDMEEYKVTSGLIDDYENQVPGPIVSSTFEIVRTIQEQDFSIEKVCDFRKSWNEYSNGNASKELALFLTDTDQRNQHKVLARVD